MTERNFDQALRDLKDRLAEMAGLVERAIEAATDALQEREPGQLGLVHELEKKINMAHKDMDEACVRLLATRQPFAADLRLIISMIKMNTDLERMGDQAVNIAHNSKKYLEGAPFKELEDLPLMSSHARTMVREALDAFVRGSESQARSVLSRDDEVDKLKHKIFQDVTARMKDKSDLIEQGLCLILIARNLERIGDHATNIAEDVIYAVKGQDIRHQPRT